jgi:hypothetical protein
VNWKQNRKVSESESDPESESESGSESDPEFESEPVSADYDRWKLLFGHQYNLDQLGNDWRKFRQKSWHIFRQTHLMNETRLVLPHEFDVVAVKWNLMDGSSKWYSGEVDEVKKNWVRIIWDDGNITRLNSDAFLLGNYNETWYYIARWIGCRVRYIGDYLNNTPGINDTEGTIIEAHGGGELSVSWDDSGEQLEAFEDLEFV